MKYIGILVNASFWPFVCVLFFTRCPAAVSWFVIAVVVNAVDRKIRRWPWSHISEKVLEPFPSFADLDSTGTVILEVAKAGIGASGTHILPCLIFNGSTTVRCVPMFQEKASSSDAKLILLQTSTTLCRVTHKSVSDDVDAVPALTPAFPLYESMRPCVSRLSIRTSSKYGKSAELLPSKIVKCRESLVTAFKAAKQSDTAPTLGGECALAA